MTEKPRRWRWQLTLRWLMLLFIPLACGLAYYGHRERQRAAASAAFIAICDKGVDANFNYEGFRCHIFFKNGNVSDSDLNAFVPAFRATVPGLPQIVALKLNGSPVSEEAITEFQKAVPDCRSNDDRLRHVFTASCRG